MLAAGSRSLLRRSTASLAAAGPRLQQKRFNNNWNRWNHDASSDKETRSPVEFFREFQQDLQMFPEYFNCVTYALFGLMTVYLLFVTSNNRARNWFFRHFSLNQENMNHNRWYTILTHSLLETSILTLVLNLLLLRWGGNIILNLGGGEAGFMRALAILTVVPGTMYTTAAAVGNKAQQHNYLQVGNATLPAAHFQSRSTVSGFQGVSAGLLANGIMEVTSRYPALFVSFRMNLALPMLISTYLVLGASGSSDSWLSLCGVITAMAYRVVLKKGF
ncbi:hypothetical protein DIPPA_34013 [Diplonema papillatum]|nr:hypothetical protein DIPPA_34013 [Diplonema papillatum]